MLTSVYLVRHAQAKGNVERRFQGHVDLPLTLEGQKQVQQVAGRLSSLPVSQIFSSPLQRAMETAWGISRSHRLVPVEDGGLIEIAGGEFENKPFEELELIYPEQYGHFLDAPHLYTGCGGESMAQVFERMRSTILRLVASNYGKTMVLVSHGCAIRCLVCWAMGLPLARMNEVPWGHNTGVSHIIFTDSATPHLQYYDDISHLQEQGAGPRSAITAKAGV